jgi:UMF1 family MFS transporter
MAVWLTVFAFLPVYAKEQYDLTISDTAFLLAAIYIGSTFTATIAGWLSDTYGAHRVILGTIVIWAGAVLLLATTTSIPGFYLALICITAVISSTPGVGRSWLASIAPVEHVSEFFGYATAAGIVADIFGPLLYGTISTVFSPRIGMLAMLPLLGVSFLLLRTVVRPPKEITGTIGV